MPVHIDLAGLRGELSSARDELEAWAHKLASDAKKDKHAHDLQMERQSGAWWARAAWAAAPCWKGELWSSNQRVLTPWRAWSAHALTAEQAALVERERALSLQVEHLAQRACRPVCGGSACRRASHPPVPCPCWPCHACGHRA